MTFPSKSLPALLPRVKRAPALLPHITLTPISTSTLRGFWASMDLMLTLLVLLSLLAPVLQLDAYQSHHAQETAFTHQHLSIVLQAAQEVYSNTLTPHPTPVTLSNLNISYLQVGYIDLSRLPQTQLTLATQAASLGFEHLDISLTSPSYSQPNQICIRRLMLISASLPNPTSGAPGLSSLSTPTSVWVCGW